MAPQSTGTTFTGGNYVGELFGLTRNENTFLGMAGGLSGGKSIRSKLFTWQDYDNGDPADTSPRSDLEADDPTYGEVVRTERSNVVQIFRRGVQVSYTRQAITNQLGVTGGASASPILGNQPVPSETAFQIQRAIEQTAAEVDWAFLNGTYAYPTDNVTARRTQGILGAITTNAVTHAPAEATFTAATTDIVTMTAHGFASGAQIKVTTAGTAGAPLALNDVYWVEVIDANTFYLHENKESATDGIVTGRVDITSATTGTWKYTYKPPMSRAMVNQLTRTMWDNQAPFRMPVFFANSLLKGRISEIYGYAPESRNVGGVNINVIENDQGTFGVALERHLADDTLLLADMSVIAPSFLPIPGKGHFFVEPKSSGGSYWNYMLFGEIGLEYGPEKWHGKITGVGV